MVMHSLGLLHPRNPATVSSLPDVVNSCPRSRPLWGRPLFASRHRGSPTLRWPIPLPAWGCSLGASRHRSSLTLRWPIPDPGCGFPLISSRHRSSLPLRCPIPARAHAFAGAAPLLPVGVPLPSAARGPFLSMVEPLLGLRPLRQPPSLFPSQRWLPPVHRRAFAGAVLFSHRKLSSLIPLPEMAYSWARLPPGCGYSLLA